MSFGQSIEVTISQDGKKVKVEALGFDDSGCLKATKTVEEALGKVIKRANKSEMLKQPVVAEKIKVGQ